MKLFLLVGAPLCLFATAACASVEKPKSNPTPLIEKETPMKYEIKIVELKPQPTLVIKDKQHIKNVGAAIESIFSRLESYMKKNDITPAGAPYTRTFVFENGFLEFESGFPISNHTAGKNDIMSSELPGGRAVSTLYSGPQEGSQISTIRFSFFTSSKLVTQ